MNIDELKPIFAGKRCVILGIGREGRVWLDILQRLGVCAEIAVADVRAQDISSLCGSEVKCIFGEDYLKRIGGYDLILQSPGVIIKDSLSASEKSRILSQTELLLRLKPCRIIGVTGTKGKSTTSSLINHLLSRCGFKTMLIGNIGVPPLKRLEEMTPDTIAVCELSCHQLEFVRHSPQTAVLLNIFPEHLDHYVSFNAYVEAKRNILRFQGEGDRAFVNADVISAAGERANPTAGRISTCAFGREADVWTDGESICLYGQKIPRERIRTPLLGKHNMYNIAVALAAAIGEGADLSSCLDALASFSGLEHRLEHVADINGVEWVNDSICTIPEAAIAAVNAFDETDCIILGGMDRGIPYDALGDFLNTGRVRNVILLPDSGRRIGALITSPDVNVVYADNMEQAVSYAARTAKKRVLLSPASASYGFYKNFEERGQHFKSLVTAVSEGAL